MMLMLLIVTSSLVIASFGEDVDFSLGEPCFSKDGSMILTAEYTGSGTVTAVQWYYSGQSANNLVVLAGTCNVFGGVPAGYPDISRMTFDCNANTFTLTLRDLKNDDFGKTWGATFNLAVGSSPDVQSDNLTICLNTTTITNSSTSITTYNNNMSHAAISTQPSTANSSTTNFTTTKSPSKDKIIIISVSVGGGVVFVVIISACCYIKKRKENDNKSHETSDL